MRVDTCYYLHSWFTFCNVFLLLVKKKEGMEESLLKDGVSTGVTTIIGSSGNSHLPAQGES